MSGKKSPQRSQRERLLGRQRPTLPYRLLVDPDGVAKARADLASAQAELRQAQMRKAAASTVRAAEAKVRRAEAKVDACYETIMLRAVSPVRMEQLAAEHPATEEQMAAARVEREQAVQRGEEPMPWPVYADSFWPALLAECATEVGMTAEEWAKFLAENLSSGELRGLRLALLNVNERERVADSLVIPKGLSQTLSSVWS